MKLGEVSQYLWGICDEYFQEVGSKTKYLANVANVARTSLSMWLSTEYFYSEKAIRRCPSNSVGHSLDVPACSTEFSQQQSESYRGILTLLSFLDFFSSRDYFLLFIFNYGHTHGQRAPTSTIFELFPLRDRRQPPGLKW
jgi:hypothetical protein